jgi:hypothetical protein
MFSRPMNHDEFILLNRAGLVDAGLSCLAVLDLSETALNRAKNRPGARASLVQWLPTDVTSSWFVSPRDLRHDRAVFHFLGKT